ncbi:hypothetical protein BGZ46_010135 [Entomortierella lignicola]|nr:hypothetical protein BGZ46_010135 [Entomortierella lignicola]
MLPKSYIAFHDLSPKATYLWVSPSVTDILGYTPEELIGTSPYDIIMLDDTPQIATVHKDVLEDDLFASQVNVCVRAKDGSKIIFTTLMNLCYDMGVSCATVLELDPTDSEQLDVQSDAKRHTPSRIRKEEFNRVKDHHKSFQRNIKLSDSGAMETEPRVCMILNRFSRNLIVMYASQSCEVVFNVKPEEIEGKPILLFVRADEMGTFMEYMDMSKSSVAIIHTRFWFQSPGSRYSVPCDVVLLGGSDGILAIVKKCKPFLRRNLIENTDCYDPLDGKDYHDPSWSSISLPSSASSAVSTSSSIIPTSTSIIPTSTAATSTFRTISTSSAFSPPSALASLASPTSSISSTALVSSTPSSTLSKQILTLEKLKSIRIVEPNDRNNHLSDKAVQYDVGNEEEIKSTIQRLRNRECIEQESVSDDENITHPSKRMKSP